MNIGHCGTIFQLSVSGSLQTAVLICLFIKSAHNFVPSTHPILSFANNSLMRDAFPILFIKKL